MLTQDSIVRVAFLAVKMIREVFGLEHSKERSVNCVNYLRVSFQCAA